MTIVEHITYQWGNKLPIRIGNQVPTNIYKGKSNEGKKTLTEVFFRVALKLRGLASVLSNLAKSYSFPFKKVDL